MIDYVKAIMDYGVCSTHIDILEANTYHNFAKEHIIISAVNSLKRRNIPLLPGQCSMCILDINYYLKRK